MVDCPKCGFAQPQDQYCANCGVDMLTYRPKQKPLFQRLISNIALQLSLLAAVVASVFLIVRHQQKMELAARVASVDDSAPSQIIERSEARSAEVAVAASPSPEAQVEPAAVPAETTSASSLAASANAADAGAQPVPASVASTEGSPGSVDASAPSAPPPPAAASPAPSASIRMTFNEVPRVFLVDLSSEPGANATSFGSIHYGVANDWINRGKAMQGAVNWRSLDATSPQSLKVGETTTVSRGPRDEASGETLGVLIFAKVVRIEEASITMSFEVSRNLTNPNATGGVEQVNRLPLPEITIPRGSAAFISGLVPHRQAQLTPPEQRLYRSDRVLQIMTSEPFRASLTDLAIFIEPSVAAARSAPAVAAPATDAK